MFTLVCGFLIWYRLRQHGAQLDDSGLFKEALNIWSPVVQRRRGTPRAIKRFGNKVRYLAMLQRSERFDKNLWEVWRDRKKPQRQAVNVAENRLVALGALYEVYGDRWRQKLRRLDDTPLDETVAAAIDRYNHAVDLVGKGGERWPPPKDEIEAFENALKGIRLFTATASQKS